MVALGSDREIADRISAMGFDPPPPKTIGGWRFRGSIPARWSPLLIQMALNEGLLKNLWALRKTA